jgi:MFS family permease
LNIDPGEGTAITMLVFNLIMALAALFGGGLIDKFGTVRIWIFCLVMQFIGTLLTSVVGDSVRGMVLIRAMHGIGMGPIMASIAALCAQWFAYRERAYVAAVQGFSVSLGISVGMVFAPSLLNPNTGWQTAMSWTSISSIFGLIFALIVLFGPQPPVVVSSAVETEKSGVASGDLKKAFGQVTIYVLLLMAFIDTWTIVAFNDMVPGYYALGKPAGLGLGPLGAGSKLMFSAYAGMIGTLLAPVITEKIFKGSPRPTITIAAVVASITLFSLRFVPANDTGMLVLYPIIIMFFSYFVNPTVYGFVAKNYPLNIVGRIGAFVFTTGVIGAVIGVGIGSFLLHKFGNYIASMNVLAAIMLAGALIVQFLRPPKRFLARKESTENVAVVKNC